MLKLLMAITTINLFTCFGAVERSNAFYWRVKARGRSIRTFLLGACLWLLLFSVVLVEYVVCSWYGAHLGRTALTYGGLGIAFGLGASISLLSWRTGKPPDLVKSRKGAQLD